MADAPTYASLTEEINSLKRLRKVHKARSDVAQKARRTKLDGPGEAVRRFTKELVEQRSGGEKRYNLLRHAARVMRPHGSTRPRRAARPAARESRRCSR